MAFLPIRPFGIAPRLLAMILLFSSAVTLVSTLVQLYFDYRHDVGVIEGRLDEIERSYLGSISQSLWNVDADQLTTQLTGILRLPDIQALQVREIGQVAHPLVVSVGQRHTSATMIREFPLVHVDGQTPHTIGLLYVEATLTGVYGRLLNTVIVILTTQGVKTFLVSLFILYIFHQLVTRHLEDIAEFIDSYDFRNPKPLRLIRRRPTHRDELDRMVTAFNDMSAELQSAYTQLRAANEELEQDLVLRASYEERLRRQAHFDDLTGLPNRVLMLDRLDQAIATAHRDQTMAALLRIDLDRFKSINDSLGHHVGDDVLTDAAMRLRECIREPDTLARQGGDEFIVILPTISGTAAARQIAERIIEACARPFVVKGQEHTVTASVGIALFPADGTDSQTLLRHADLAMTKAKDSGRNRYCFFTQEINQRMQERLTLEQQLRSALNNGELLLQYQPIIELRDDRPVALEALIRWRVPDLGLRMPATFVPLAEEIGLSRDIDEWVIATACAEIQSSAAGGPLPRLAVNISPRQLQSAGFAQRVAKILAKLRFPPERLELEISETGVMDDRNETGANLRMLSDLGIRLSIDDFGTGNASLGFLQHYPFDILKIDRSFTAGVLHNAKTARLVESVITMAHGLGLEVIAEGVETPEQLAFLRENGCDLAQGFLISRPASLEALALKIS